jgi:hypothetical protein
MDCKAIECPPIEQQTTTVSSQRLSCISMKAILSPQSTPCQSNGPADVSQKIGCEFRRTEGSSPPMRNTTSARALVAVFASAAFLWALALGASPQLHQRIHKDANSSDHSCAVTLVASGSLNHCSSAALVRVPAPSFEFIEQLELNSVWVQPLFLGAHIFAHAPPALT